MWIGSRNQLRPARCQVIIISNVNFVSTGSVRTNCSEILIYMQQLSHTKMDLNISSAKWGPCGLGLDVISKPRKLYQSGTTTSIRWWRFQMETLSALLTLCARNSPVPGEFPAQWPVTPSFHVFFDLRLNKPLSKQASTSPVNTRAVNLTTLSFLCYCSNGV